MKIGRNSPCPCGSGKKYKKCCLGKNISALSALGTTNAPIEPEAKLEDFRVMQQNLFFIAEQAILLAEKAKQIPNEIATDAIRAFKSETLEDRHWVLLATEMLFVSVYQTTRAVVSLCSFGLIEDAGKLFRSLFETVVNFLYILKFPKSAKLYIDYMHILEKRFVDAHLKDDPNRIDAETYRKIVEQYERVKPQFPKRLGGPDMILQRWPEIWAWVSTTI